MAHRSGVARRRHDGANDADQRRDLARGLDSRDLERLLDLLDDRVVWRGVPAPGEEDEHGGAEDHEDSDVPICTDRDQVRAVFERFLGAGRAADPVVLAEVGDSVLVDPRADLARPIELYQTLTFRGGRVVLIQDCHDRASASAVLGL